MIALTPELQILILNAVVLLVAYGGIYPSMREVTVERLARSGLVVGGSLLLVAGALFMGSGTSFSLFGFSTNWFVFTLVTEMIMELPIFVWFCRRHGLAPFRMDGGDS